ncbi:MAG: bifunctional 4-hydroxy-2-oxoglutarate aldolase/2-dehydro-3-deoxy-phosphogluconate aldolase [Proteobacteria bacterium]|jgi:2-dehydro-3-deoxyphosphogluconate aldolase / (4S)-4-hydroxy-2-oxoglutarate aldolase|nr:bifunctional 4-hydroxy-2-oxoglutarate aldolase/2-dehydro-3-deoxy-phosphogluconate aldolase [Pseudomonadota bacterium]MDA0872774.1 bifunctional 4-hydroxy-2-oxoglutarate aldolase/2-dehydro-3-deoxy-phosphogluconate aldolase [Pseudomonadota bacterium]MDA1133963.1 bifunctional 4-hydroxy-2-oxoglutarate aldolase/2-dehydro-3-deoxy-phosphogluconate aldolase [Pseudomonadota bacterium]
MKTIELANYGPVIPVIVIDNVEDAVPMAEALLEGGIRVLEVTLRSNCALQAIEAIAKNVPEAIVGAGTLRTKADATNAKIAGSQFAVSPGYSSNMGSICKEIDLPLLPGVSSGSEIMMANDDGYDFLKLFPAVAVGGVNLLKGFSGPFADVKFCPTGGVTIQNASDFLALPNVIVCGGTWLTPKEYVNQKNWAKITQLAKEASSIKF